MTIDIDARKAEFEKNLAFARLDESDRKQWETNVIMRAIEFVADNTGVDETFSSDDVRPLLPEVHPNRIGRCFALAQKRGKIEAVGWMKSGVVSSHARKVGTYRKAPTPADMVR